MSQFPGAERELLAIPRSVGGHQHWAGRPTGLDWEQLLARRRRRHQATSDRVKPVWQYVKKGLALAEKASARTDFSYVPGHLGEF